VLKFESSKHERIPVLCPLSTKRFTPRGWPPIHTTCLSLVVSFDMHTLKLMVEVATVISPGFQQSSSLT